MDSLYTSVKRILHPSPILSKKYSTSLRSIYVYLHLDLIMTATIVLHKASRFLPAMS